MPRASAIIKHGRGLAQLRHSDIWLASYPRSGNTRVRMLLAQLQLIRSGSEAICEPSNVEDHMPVWGFSDLEQFDETHRFVKTHRSFAPPMSKPDRTLLIVREPDQAIASYYKMVNSRSAETTSFSDFLRSTTHGYPRWQKMLETWVPQATAIIEYAELMANDEATMTAALETLGIPVVPEQLRAAIDLTSIERTSKAERINGLRDGDRFDASFKAVGPGDGTHAQELMTEADRAWLRAQLERDGLGRWTHHD